MIRIPTDASSINSSNIGDTINVNHTANNNSRVMTNISGTASSINTCLIPSIAGTDNYAASTGTFCTQPNNFDGNNSMKNNGIIKLPSIAELFSNSINTIHNVNEPQVSSYNSTFINFRAPNYSLDSTNPKRYAFANRSSGNTGLCGNYNNEDSGNLFLFNKSISQPLHNINKYHHISATTVTGNKRIEQDVSKRDRLDNLYTTVQTVENGKDFHQNHATTKNITSHSVQCSDLYSIGNDVNDNTIGLAKDIDDCKKCRDALNNLSTLVVKLQNYNKKWDTILNNGKCDTKNGSNNKNKNSKNNNHNSLYKYLDIPDIDYAIELSNCYEANLQILMDVKKKNLKLYPDSDLESFAATSISSGSDSASASTTTTTTTNSSSFLYTPQNQAPQLYAGKESCVPNDETKFSYTADDRNNIIINKKYIAPNSGSKFTFVNPIFRRRTLFDASKTNYHHNYNNCDGSLVNGYHGTHILSLSNILANTSNSNERLHPLTFRDKLNIDNNGNNISTNANNRVSNIRMENRKKSKNKDEKQYIESKDVIFQAANRTNGSLSRLENGPTSSFSDGRIKKSKTTNRRRLYGPNINSNSKDVKCLHCGQNDTPEWRKGPYGSRTLCNACGLFYGKLVKKFGVANSNLLMHYRRSQKIENRRVPKAVEIPESFISQFSDKTT
ncbi:Gat2p SCDLUD_002633 [Saccharomycodes ludwigii]|uniref:Gat2p n=1 Tax=Saccharomycodes ludwigii TaxID=36035 RepID=UPI001E83EB07|nr:hypothetical protein SCDLUD_002633 [Saccharomycodes ludwigii]KAH3901150.1 hypothetical protein SCDLUD_002633 [Saccharomycodes ludwigii]